jgi:hypothetical protein
LRKINVFKKGLERKKRRKKTMSQKHFFSQKIFSESFFLSQKKEAAKIKKRFFHIFCIRLFSKIDSEAEVPFFNCIQFYFFNVFYKNNICFILARIFLNISFLKKSHNEKTVTNEKVFLLAFIFFFCWFCFAFLAVFFSIV